MRIDINGKSKDSELVEGSYEKMMDMRKRMLSRIEKNINSALDGYDGGLIALFVMKEDENGKCVGSNVFISGVSRPESSLALAKVLSEASEEVVDTLLDEIKKQDPEDVVKVIKQLKKFVDNELKEV